MIPRRPSSWVTLWLDADVRAALKATDLGWQRHMNDAMREWVTSHAAG